MTPSSAPAIHLGSVRLVAGLPVIEGIFRAAAASADGSARVSNEDFTETCAALEIQPTAIVVLDLDGSYERGLEHLRSIRRLFPAARPIVLSSRGNGVLILDVLRLGARAFVHAPDGFPGLPDILVRVAAGERFVSAELEPSVFLELPAFIRRAREGSQMDQVITGRQQQVLELLADGCTNAQIGRRLAISPRTVETHVAKVYRTLSVRTRLQAIARAAALGVIEVR